MLVNLPKVSFIVPCKGRLEHIQQTLPTLVNQPNSEYILVDFDCPQKTGDWAKVNYPNVTVARVSPDILPDKFNVAMARNIGAKAARTEWLCFIDADNSVIIDDFVNKLNLESGFSYRPSPIKYGQGFTGFKVVEKCNFDKVFGYDEGMTGWGYEDEDLHTAISKLGIKTKKFPVDWISSIKHGNDLRTGFYDDKNKYASNKRNFEYSKISTWHKDGKILI